MRNAGRSTALTREEAIGIRVLVADDDPSVRSLFGLLLRPTSGVFSVLKAEDGARAVEVGRDLRVDVAVLDLYMPRLDGVQAARLLVALQPPGEQSAG